jgi:hypothetical protein
MWTFSFDVHRHVSSVVGRVFRALRRAGADIPPMTYGMTWILFDPRMRRTINEGALEGRKPLSLEAAGIRPGSILLVLSPEAVPQEPSNSLPPAPR